MKRTLASACGVLAIGGSLTLSAQATIPQTPTTPPSPPALSATSVTMISDTCTAK